MKPSIITLSLVAGLLVGVAGCNSSDEKAADTQTEKQTLAANEQAVNKESQIPKVTLEKKSMAEDKMAELNELKQQAIAWHQGTVTHKSFEGGFYGITTDEGQKFLPLNLDKAYQQDGAKIKFRGKVDKEINTIQQWGTPIHLIEVELLKKGSAVDPSLT